MGESPWWAIRTMSEAVGDGGKNQVANERHVILTLDTRYLRGLFSVFKVKTTQS